MTFLATEFFQDLIEEGIGAEEFDAAVKLVNRSNRFFPVMADILEAARTARADRRQKQIQAAQERQRLQLMEPGPTEEEIQQGLKHIWEIKAMLSGKMEMP